MEWTKAEAKPVINWKITMNQGKQIQVIQFKSAGRGVKFKLSTPKDLIDLICPLDHIKVKINIARRPLLIND